MCHLRMQAEVSPVTCPYLAPPDTVGAALGLILVNLLQWQLWKTSVKVKYTRSWLKALYLILKSPSLTRFLPRYMSWTVTDHTTIFSFSSIPLFILHPRPKQRSPPLGAGCLLTAQAAKDNTYLQKEGPGFPKLFNHCFGHRCYTKVF